MSIDSCIPVIQSALANWKEECLYLSDYTSTYWEEYCLVRLAVVYRGRALPVVWRVLKHLWCLGCL
ncbi:hypothetical protein [Oscillatoria sp. HE19RPO]|uniref:hypothetical protein n=1 Tax=Oscillatoria sp. HE19RPO TaxID=2954806 RepID=UPI0020C296B3|nr:hypothetical protein [Oscillatoria sp. HE19RPO]